MTNILLTVSYDGTDFCGWQRQDKSDNGSPVRTVQGEIENALFKMLKVPVKLSGSGRTDSGVHAAGQAANFESPEAAKEAQSISPRRQEHISFNKSISGRNEINHL